MIMMIMMMINNAILQKHRQGRHIPKISSFGVEIAELQGGSTWKTSMLPRPFINNCNTSSFQTVKIEIFVQDNIYFPVHKKSDSN